MKAAILAGFLFGLGAAQAGSPTPETAAQGFYAVYATFHSSDGIPDAESLAKYAPYLSPALAGLLRRGEDAEASFAKANKDAPPLIEGDLFTSLFEGATAYKLEPCQVAGDKANCRVDLVHDESGQKPVAWSDTAILVKTGSGWALDDIVYGGTWPFGNKGRLTQVLHEAIADGGD